VPNEPYPAELNSLGDHLRKRRLDLGLFQKEVANQIGVNKDTMKNWKNNATCPALPYIPQIIKFLGYCPYDPTLSFPQKLKTWREALGLSQDQLARVLGMDKGTIQKWEARKHIPMKRSRQIVVQFLANLEQKR
jgi:DNA-binding transcriptional regulator YiaG